MSTCGTPTYYVGYIFHSSPVPVGSQSSRQPLLEKVPGPKPNYEPKHTHAKPHGSCLYHQLMQINEGANNLYDSITAKCMILYLLFLISMSNNIFKAKWMILNLFRYLWVALFFKGFQKIFVTAIADKVVLRVKSKTFFFFFFNLKYFCCFLSIELKMLMSL